MEQTFEICQDFPALIFSSELERKALITFHFFPSASELFKLLCEAVGPLRSLRKRLEVIANARPSRAPEPEMSGIMTREGRDAVANLLKVFVQERAVASQPRLLTRPPPRPSARYLPPELLTRLRAEGLRRSAANQRLGFANEREELSPVGDGAPWTSTKTMQLKPSQEPVPDRPTLPMVPTMEVARTGTSRYLPEVDGACPPVDASMLR